MITLLCIYYDFFIIQKFVSYFLPFRVLLPGLFYHTFRSPSRQRRTHKITGQFIPIA